MTSIPDPSPHPEAQESNGNGTAARLLSPREESVRAIEATRHALQEAIAGLESSGDERVARAYEFAAECADHVARALWFLRRLEGESAAAGQTTQA